eukprot:scaffold85090_cov22-Tisochrysis_lutea.AAC.2
MQPECLLSSSASLQPPVRQASSKKNKTAGAVGGCTRMLAHAIPHTPAARTTGTRKPVTQALRAASTRHCSQHHRMGTQHQTSSFTPRGPTR